MNLDQSSTIEMTCLYGIDGASKLVRSCRDRLYNAIGAQRLSFLSFEYLPVVHPVIQP